jgi:flagellar biosynthetic protein FlhB
MAESSDGQERSEEPTEKRLQDARKKGQVARSKELTTLAALLFAAAMFLVGGQAMLAGLVDVMKRYFTLTRWDLDEVANLPTYFLAATIDALLAIAPFMAAMALAAVLSNVALGGWNFTADAMMPKLNKLDPIKGLKRVFGWRGIVELLKALAKFVLIAVVAALVYYLERDAFMGLALEPLDQALAHVGSLLTWSFLLISSALLLVVLIDIPFQIWDHKRQLKMTKQEIKEERKQSDGDPKTKGRQRQIQFDMAQRRMMSEVPTADVVVTNPNHYAVALRYEQNAMDAPVVVAKGMNLIAAEIRRLAKEHDVPILEAAPLARAIYHSTELNQAIPAGLYRAVAQVLAYVYHLRQGPVYNRSGRGPAPSLDDLPIPEELRRDA